MEINAANIEKMEAQLKQWSTRLDGFLAKAGSASVGAKSEYSKYVNDLIKKHLAAQSKLDELKAADSDQWETLKAGVESAWNELEVAFRRLKN